MTRIRKKLHNFKIKWNMFRYKAGLTALTKDYNNGDCEEHPFRVISKLYGIKIIKLRKQLK